MKPVVMMVCGNPVGRFDCIGDAAKMLNIQTTTLTNRILRGAVVNDIQFRFRESDEDDALTNMSPQREKAKKPTEQTISKVKVKKKLKYKSDDVDLTNTKYTIVPYEVKYGRVCVTRCTALEAPQPFVGSAQCANCPHFHGRNKKTHQVSCSNIIRRSLR